MPPFGNCDHCNQESELYRVEDDQKFCSVCRSAYEEGRKAFIKHELKYAIAKHVIGKIDQVRVSSDPEKQRDYEVFCKGWDAGVENVIIRLNELKDSDGRIEMSITKLIPLIKGENK